MLQGLNCPYKELSPGICQKCAAQSDNYHRVTSGKILYDKGHRVGLPCPTALRREFMGHGIHYNKSWLAGQVVNAFDFQPFKG